MGRGRCDHSPPDPLVSKFRVRVSGVDRSGSVAGRRRPAAGASAGVDPWLGGGNSLLLYHLLLAHLFNDPLRGTADGPCVRGTHSGGGRDRDLSGSGNDAGSDGDQAMGHRVGPTRSGVLDGFRVGAAGGDGSTMERTRLLAGFLSTPARTGSIWWSLRAQLSDRLSQRCRGAGDRR